MKCKGSIKSKTFEFLIQEKIIIFFLSRQLLRSGLRF